jgi:hypothetical protein
MFVAGGQALGRDFIGRDQEMQYVFEKLKEKNCVSVVGLPRIGKSSLIKNLLLNKQTELEALRIKTISYSITPEENKLDFFRYFLEEVAEIVNLSNLHYDKRTEMQRLIALQLTAIDKGYVSDERIIAILNKLYDYDSIRIRIIIDEFDRAPLVMGNLIDKIREIVSVPPSTRLLTISRVPLYELFPKGTDGSNFPGVAQSGTIFLKGFSEKDRACFIERLTAEIGEPNNDVLHSLTNYTGNFPYFLALWANSYIEVKKRLNNDAVTEVLKSQIKESCWNDYSSEIHYLWGTLSRSGLIQFIQDFSTQQFQELDRAKQNALLSYGLVTPDHNSLTIPYLSEYKSKQHIDFDEESVCLLCQSITSLLSKTKQKQGVLAQYYNHNHEKTLSMESVENYLAAAETKLCAAVKLHSLGTDIAIQINNEDIYAITQELNKCELIVNSA